jgi:hypothetical protein
MGGSAAPPSGDKYQGFGSADIAAMGYNDQNKFAQAAPYDPYTSTT